MASLGQARTVCWPLKPLTVLDLEAPFVSPLGWQGKSKSAARKSAAGPGAAPCAPAYGLRCGCCPWAGKRTMGRIRFNLGKPSVHAKSGETL